MIEQAFFKSFSFPCVVYDTHGLVVHSGGGALFPSPTEASTVEQFEYYSLAPYGWTCCPAGYAIYVTDIKPIDGFRLVVYGLKVRGVSSIQGKSKLLNIYCDRKNIESYVKNSIISLKESENILKSIVRSGVHEVRNINKDLYNAIYELRFHIEDDRFNKTVDLEIAKNVEALSELLRVRYDVFDVISNPPFLNGKTGYFRVYRGFDRIRKSLWASARSKNLSVYMKGESQGSVEGIKLFDVIPYLLIQNSIKYAPEGTDVTIDVRETDDLITIQLSSFGPALEVGEEKRVFMPGVRGRNATLMQSQGSGIGLYICKKLVEMHDGASIQIYQEPEIREFKEGVFRRTHFNLRFLRSK